MDDVAIVPIRPLGATYDTEQEAAWRLWWDTLRDAEAAAMRAAIGLPMHERLAFRAGWIAGRAAVAQHGAAPTQPEEPR